MAIETRAMRDLVSHCPANILRSDGILAPLFTAIARCDARQMSHRSLYRVRRAYNACSSRTRYRMAVARLGLDENAKCAAVPGFRFR